MVALRAEETDFMNQLRNLGTPRLCPDEVFVGLACVTLAKV